MKYQTQFNEFNWIISSIHQFSDTFQVAINPQQRLPPPTTLTHSLTHSHTHRYTPIHTDTLTDTPSPPILWQNINFQHKKKKKTNCVNVPDTHPTVGFNTFQWIPQLRLQRPPPTGDTRPDTRLWTPCPTPHRIPLKLESINCNSIEITQKSSSTHWSHMVPAPVTWHCTSFLSIFWKFFFFDESMNFCVV